MEMMFSEICIYIYIFKYNIFLNIHIYIYTYIYICIFVDSQRNNCIAHTLAGIQMRSTQVRNLSKHWIYV